MSYQDRLSRALGRESFDLGDDDEHISTIDPSRLALIAIQKLLRRNQQMAIQIDCLREVVKQLLEK